MRVLAAISFLCFALSGTGSLLPASARADVNGGALPIGDNVIVVPDPRARLITGWLVVRAGCADEADGQCLGIAHYLEHLLFINRDNEHRSKVAFFPDGSGNGWTNHRATVYFQRFPSRPATDADSLDKLIEYFAGLLSEVRVEGPQAERERNVVLQEFQQNTGRNPFARFQIELNRALLPGEPLGQRVIGSPRSIADFTPEAARAFHARWYARNNAYIVLHGPVDVERVKAAIDRHVLSLPVKPVPPHLWRESRTYEPGRQTLRASGADVRQVGAFLERIANFEEPALERQANDAALGVLSAFLASELPGSPHDVLMERDGLVTQTRLSVSRVRDGTLRLSFSGMPAASVTPERVLDAARAYLEQLWRQGIGNETVERLKARIAIERDLLAAQPALYAQALTNWLAAHGSRKEWLERRRYHEAVEPERLVRLLAIVTGQVREVAGILQPSGSAAPGSRGKTGSAPGKPVADPPLMVGR